MRIPSDDSHGTGRILAQLRDTDNHTEVISFDQLWIGTSISFAVAHHFAHTGTEFVGTVNFPKKRTENEVFLVGNTSLRVKNTETVGAAGIIGNHATVFDNEPGAGTGSIFTVDYHVGGHFPKDMISQAATFNSFQIKWIGQVLVYEGENSVVTVDDIGDNQIPIIVAVSVDFAQEQVGTMGGTYPADLFIVTEEHNTGQGNPGLTGFRITLNQLGTLKQFRIVHIRPEVILAVNPDVSAASIDQIRTQTVELYHGVDPILTVSGLLTLIETSHFLGKIGNVQVGIFVTIINSAAAAVNLGTFRHIDMQNRFAVQFGGVNRKVGWGRELPRIVNGVNKILADMFKGTRIDSRNGAIILHAQQHRTSVTIQKSTNRIVHGPGQLLASGLELDIHAFALGDHGF